MVWEGFNQVQVQPKIGLEFRLGAAPHLAAGSRHHHGRRNSRPRDRENAIQSALTGHLVLSHAPHQRRRSAQSSRMTDLGVRAVSAQLHAARRNGAATVAPQLPSCAQPVSLTQEQMLALKAPFHWSKAERR